MRKYGAFGSIGPAKGFTWNEVRCTDGTLPNDRQSRKRFRRQARNLNKFRALIKKHYKGATRVSINVNSWYRSYAYNASIGGAKASQHVQCRATDITVTVYFKGHHVKVSPKTVAALAEGLPLFANGGIGWYDVDHGNFTHVDSRPDGPARWVNG
jgi:uncharacterized protein YcbK (DUF882 family)